MTWYDIIIIKSNNNNNNNNNNSILSTKIHEWTVTLNLHEITQWVKIGGPEVNTYRKNDPELYLWPRIWPRITKLTPEIDSSGQIIRKTCIARDCKLTSRKVIIPPPSAAAILDLCKLAEFPKVATLATELDFLHRLMRIRNHQKTIHFSQQQGTQPGNWTNKRFDAGNIRWSPNYWLWLGANVFL